MGAFHFRTAIWAGALILLNASPVFAYPEFETAVKMASGRNVNCALCHRNGEGPEGNNRGQMGRLLPTELDALSVARGAMVPGTAVDSPILNAFGNHLVSNLGRTKIIEARLRGQANPLDGLSNLSASLSTIDFDGDGASDREELFAGTHPAMAHHGPLLTTISHRLKVHFWRILFTALGCALMLWGLRHLILAGKASSKQ